MMQSHGIVSHTNFGDQEPAMQAYLQAGEKRAYSLGNRGPVKFGADGRLDASILESFSEHGFYIFENVLKSDELRDIEGDVENILDRLPSEKGSAVDSKGRPALAAECKGRNLKWARPLGDPLGGSETNYGRHQIRMTEPIPSINAPKEVVFVILGSLQFSDACLRVYGHPDLLAVAEAINGYDFVPFNEALFFKEPGRGASVSWHQDGFTHWDNPNLDEGTHGFSFMAQLFGCTPANGLWVVPGTHRQGKLDITRMLKEGEADRIPEAVPMVCSPGDVAICNRQVVHGSFANTSQDWRITVNFGFHRRSSVFNIKSGGIHNDVAVYDSERIEERSRLIAYAINARQQRFPDEIPYIYRPFEGRMENFEWDEAAQKSIRDYNDLDMGI